MLSLLRLHAVKTKNHQREPRLKNGFESIFHYVIWMQSLRTKNHLYDAMFSSELAWRHCVVEDRLSIWCVRRNLRWLRIASNKSTKREKKNSSDPIEFRRNFRWQWQGSFRTSIEPRLVQNIFEVCHNIESLLMRMFMLSRGSWSISTSWL